MKKKAHVFYSAFIIVFLCFFCFALFWNIFLVYCEFMKNCIVNIFFFWQYSSLSLNKLLFDNCFKLKQNKIHMLLIVLRQTSYDNFLFLCFFSDKIFFYINFFCFFIQHLQWGCFFFNTQCNCRFFMFPTFSFCLFLIGCWNRWF